MDTISQEKRYRIILKEGNHLSTKLNSDGSRAAIQFSDDGNILNGPINLVEVDESEFIPVEYVPMQDKPRTFKEIVWQEVVVPAMREVLYQAMMEGYSNLRNQLKTKTLPMLKDKTQGFLKDVGIIASGIKDGLAGETPKALELLKDNAVVEASNPASVVEIQQKTVRSREEIESIVYAMRVSAVTLAACIRSLNNTAMVDDGSNPQLRLEIQRNIQALSVSDVMQQIELLLEEKNKELLDEAEFATLLSFKEGYLLINGARVPLARYLED